MLKYVFTSAAAPKSIIQVAGDVSARANVSGNKRIEKSYKEGFSRNLCKTDALFAPQLSKQHEFVRQQMRRTYYQRVCILHFYISQ